MRMTIDVERVTGGAKANQKRLNEAMRNEEPVMLLERHFYQAGRIVAVKEDSVELKIEDEVVELGGADVESCLVLFGDEGVYEMVKEDDDE